MNGFCVTVLIAASPLFKSDAAWEPLWFLDHLATDLDQRPLGSLCGRVETVVPRSPA
jgi:hypothetical protein